MNELKYRPQVDIELSDISKETQNSQDQALVVRTEKPHRASRAYLSPSATILSLISLITCSVTIGFTSFARGNFNYQNNISRGLKIFSNHSNSFIRDLNQDILNCTFNSKFNFIKFCVKDDSHSSNVLRSCIFAASVFFLEGMSLLINCCACDENDHNLIGFSAR